MKNQLEIIVKRMGGSLRRNIRRRGRALTGYDLIEEIATRPIPPNDADPKVLQNYCYDVRLLAEEWLDGN